MVRPLLIITAGLFVVWVGLRSVGGYEAEAQHLYGGEFQKLTCEDGRPIDGLGMHTLSAQRACHAEQDQQRSRAPWWIAFGVGVMLFGMSRFRKARAG